MSDAAWECAQRWWTKAMEKDERIAELERRLAEARAALRVSFMAGYWAWCGPANGRELEAAIKDEQEQWERWQADMYDPTPRAALAETEGEPKP